MTGTNFTLFLLAALVIAIVPGPGIFYVAARTLSGGSKAGIASTFGTALGGLVHVVAGALGVSAIILASAELFAAACEVGPVIANRPKAEQTACRSVGMNLGIAFQLVDDVLDYGGKAAKLGKNIGDDFREGKITLPVVLAFRRGNDSERAFWIRALERGEIGDSPRESGYPVRCGFSIESPRSLEYWITRIRG